MLNTIVICNAIKYVQIKSMRYWPVELYWMGYWNIELLLNWIIGTLNFYWMGYWPGQLNYYWIGYWPTEHLSNGKWPIEHIVLRDLISRWEYVYRILALWILCSHCILYGVLHLGSSTHFTQCIIQSTHIVYYWGTTQRPPRNTVTMYKCNVNTATKYVKPK